jgi:hypothetical protein
MRTKRIVRAVVEVVLILSAAVVLLMAMRPTDPSVTKVFSRPGFYPCPEISLGRCAP